MSFRRESYEPIAKPGRVVNPAGFRMDRPPWCEYCATPATDAVQIQAHHVRSRGSGGDDLPGNRAWLCGRCHRAVHDGQITLTELVNRVRMHRS